jgi:hypothetical protein
MRNLTHLDIDPMHQRRANRPSGAMSRRAVVHAGGVTFGSAAVAAALGPAAAAGRRLRPVPIPGGIEVGGKRFHLYPPEPGNDVSTITDFVGDVGVAVIDGRWEVTEGDPDDRVRRGAYEIDLRFMKGLFRGADKGFHQATFGFV